jgi:hypothetical protein
MAGSSKTTSTTFQSQPGVIDVLGTAKTIFDSGIPWVPDTSSHVTPFSAQTRAGLTGLYNQASDANTRSAFNNNFNNIANLTRDGGLNSLQNQQVGRLQGIADAPIAEGTSQFNDAQRQAYDYLNPIAGGQARQSNPYLDEVIRRSSDDIGNSVNLQASAAGRYGSGTHQGALADAVGDMSANLRYQDYGAQQQRQDNAINALFGMGSQANAQSEADWGRRMDAIGSLFNAGREQRQNVLNSTQQLQDAYNAKLAPYQTMLGVGREYEGLQSRVLQDQARILQERKNALTDPVNWLANLAGAFQGGQQVTTQKTSESPFGSSLFSSLLGRVLGG